MSIETMKSQVVQSDKPTSQVDIIKKYNNIKLQMDKIKGRMFIHEFTYDCKTEVKNEKCDEINYDIIYA